MAQPIWASISTIFSIEELTRRGDVTRFSTPRRMPFDVATCEKELERNLPRCSLSEGECAHEERETEVGINTYSYGC